VPVSAEEDMTNPTGFGTPPAAYFPTPPMYDYSQHYAGLGARFVAAILDLLLLLLATALVALPFGVLASAVVLTGNAPAWALGLIFGPLTLILVVLWLFYFTYFESATGQTLGKRAMGIRVVDPTTGRPPTLTMALVRSVVRIVDWLPFLYLVGFLVALVTSRRQRLGDLLAGTVVIKG
jgi:uncharacterized RDD family membrane protein YckC